VQIIGSGVNEDIQRSKETLASLIQDVKKVSSTEDATQKIQEQAALAISHILNTQGNASAHGTSFLHAIYDYFIHENNAAHKGSFLKGYSEDKLAEYFKVLLQTLALLVEKNISMNTFEQLDKIFFPAADRREFSNFLNDSLSLKIEILYFDLISLVKECSTIPECAKKLASKFHSHKIKYKQLHVNYLNDDSTDIDELSKQELKLRSEFLDSSMGQTQLNKKVQQDLSDCSQRILMMQQSHKMALGEYASEHDNAQSEEFKKIKWAEYLTNEKELIQSYSNADYLFKYFYERELGLIEDAYDKNKGVIGEVTAEQLNRQKIEEAKQRFNVDLFTQEYMSKSSLVRAFPCTKFAIETDTAVALVITNQYEARAYHKTIIETQKKAAKINQKPYREIQAQYNPVVRCKLNAEHRTRLERRWRVARYIGLGTLGLVGLGLLGFASAATFGLIHLAWVIPVVSFSVGGTAVAGTTIGVVANTPSYRDVIVGTCKKMAKRIGLLQHPYSPLVNELDEEAIDYASGSEAEDDGNDSPLMHREEPDFTKDPPKIITLEGDTSSSEDEDEDEELASIGSSAAGSPHYSILPPHSVTPYDNKRLLLPPPHQCLFQPVGGVDSDGDTFSQDRRPTIVV
jgi:spore germination cell wall hydrolase CwlJ-like protein